LRRAFTDQIADDHQPGGNPNTRLELDGFDVEATDRVDSAEPGPDRALGILLMGSRVAEIDQDAVAHVFRDKPVELGNHRGDSAVIGGDNLPQILGIEPRRKRGRVDEIAEHYRQLPPLGLHTGSGGCGSNGRRFSCWETITEGSDSVEQSPTVAD
jgi:hypothetical protein